MSKQDHDQEPGGRRTGGRRDEDQRSVPRRAITEPMPVAEKPEEPAQVEQTEEMGETPVEQTSVEEVLLETMDPSRPPRPEMERKAAPKSMAVQRPGIVKAAGTLLYAGLGVGLLGVITSFLWREGTRTSLIDAMAISEAEAATKERVADIFLYGSIGAMLLLLLIELLLVSRIGSGRAGARVGLTILVPAHLVLLFYAQGIIPETDWHGTLIQVSLLVLAVLLVVGTALTWAPTASRWLARSRTSRLSLQPQE